MRSLLALLTLKGQGGHGLRFRSWLTYSTIYQVSWLRAVVWASRSRGGLFTETKATRRGRESSGYFPFIIVFGGLILTPSLISVPKHVPTSSMSSKHRPQDNSEHREKPIQHTVLFLQLQYRWGEGPRSSNLLELSGLDLIQKLKLTQACLLTSFFLNTYEPLFIYFLLKWKSLLLRVNQCSINVVIPGIERFLRALNLKCSSTHRL